MHSQWTVDCTVMINWQPLKLCLKWLISGVNDKLGTYQCPCRVLVGILPNQSLSHSSVSSYKPRKTNKGYLELNPLPALQLCPLSWMNDLPGIHPLSFGPGIFFPLFQHRRKEPLRISFTSHKEYHKLTTHCSLQIMPSLMFLHSLHFQCIHFAFSSSKPLVTNNMTTKDQIWPWICCIDPHNLACTYVCRGTSSKWPRSSRALLKPEKCTIAMTHL